jgi:hypothetical protein
MRLEDAKTHCQWQALFSDQEIDSVIKHPGHLTYDEINIYGKLFH